MAPLAPATDLLHTPASQRPCIAHPPPRVPASQAKCCLLSPPSMHASVGSPVRARDIHTTPPRVALQYLPTPLRTAPRGRLPFQNSPFFPPAADATCTVTTPSP